MQHNNKTTIQMETTKKETRSFTGTVELRKEGDEFPKEVRGMAAVTNSTTDLGWFEEEIAAGAFDDVLNDDVRVLGNHDPNIVLGRTAAGTAKIWVEDNHLHYSFVPDELNPLHVSWVRSIQRNDVNQSSFAFEIESQTWSNSAKYGDLGKRTINKVSKLWDVSPVTYPAYDDTTVAARSHEAVKAEIVETTDHNEDYLDDYYRSYYELIIK
jgi:HK97 family phage prohead protease